jgi:2-dehydro-3-deoxygalactonokinase
VTAAFLCGDWGTTRLRLFLCDGQGAVLARREGPGIAEAGSRAAEIFAGLTADWDSSLPALLSGMVGSTIGWREAAYLPCPVAAEAVAEAALRFESGKRAIAIVPGLSCTNALGLFDVMRGEETQLLGALRLKPQPGRRLFCLPGTHAKWVLVEDGTVLRFQTALSGELFALLAQHSVLARGSQAARDGTAFREGLAVARGEDRAELLHLLFSTRSRQLKGELVAADAGSYLSGLVVGADVAAALRLFAPHEPVTLIGAPDLTALYGVALGPLAGARIDGDDAVLAGLGFLHRHVWRG